MAGFLRVKTIKGHRYVYWCERTRSRKKFGGNGKVKGSDLLIGNNPLWGKYLAFYLFGGEVPLQDYVQAVLTHILEIDYHVSSNGEVKQKVTDVARLSINWQANPSVCLRSLDKRFDLRYRSWRQLRQDLQKYLEAILKESKLIQDWIERIAFYLARYQNWSKQSEINRDKLREYHLNPAKTWTKWESSKNSETGQWQQKEITYWWKEDADIILDESITACEKNALWFWDKYQERLNQVIGYAPQRRQDEFRHTALSRIEKLAKDEQWVERYGWQMESAS